MKDVDFAAEALPRNMYSKCIRSGEEDSQVRCIGFYTTIITLENCDKTILEHTDQIVTIKIE